MNSASKYIFFASIAIGITQPIVAETAAFKAYGYQCVFYPATTSLGSKIYLTTYDGSSVWPLNDNNTISSELKPSFIGSSTYRADYLAADSSVFEHGTISLNMPTTDSDGNGVFDWLQQDMAVNTAIVTGTSTVHWLAAGAVSGNATIFGQMTRQAGSNSGTYSMTYNISGLGTIVATGTWEVGYWQGSITYGNGSYAVSSSMLGNGGASTTIAGSSTYSSSGTDTLQLGSIQLTDGIGTISMPTSSLTRSGNVYSTRVSLDDGKYTTSWDDYVDWFVVITDTNDVDSDGVPDFTDTSNNIVASSTSPGTPPVDESYQSSVSSASPGAPGGITRDFNNDGNDDVILFNTSTNELYVANLESNSSWTGTEKNSKISIFAADGDGASWDSPAAADFNMDGYLDIVLQHKEIGVVNVAQMSSSGTWDGTKWSFYTSNLYSEGAGWRARATGDFNGDTKPDIVFQHDTTGDVFVCYVTSTAEWALPTASSITGRYLLSEAKQGFKVYPWIVRGSGDFNGDGQMDLVFQNNDTSDVYTTYLSSTGEWNYGLGRYIYSTAHQGASAGSWQIKASGDFNNDGFPDLTFQNGNSKDIFIIYLTNNTSEWNQGTMGGRYLISSGNSTNYIVAGPN